MDPRLVKLRIGRRIREIRTSRGLSQEDLASKVGVSYQQIQRYEAGNSNLPAPVLLALSQAFRVPVDAFFEDFKADEVRPILTREEWRMIDALRAAPKIHEQIFALVQLLPKNRRR